MEDCKYNDSCPSYDSSKCSSFFYRLKCKHIQYFKELDAKITKTTQEIHSRSESRLEQTL